MALQRVTSYQEIIVREDCAICVNKEDSDKRTHFDVSNVGYEGDCLGYTRIREHLADYRDAATANLPP